MMLLTLALGCGVSEEALLRDLDDGNWGRICRDFEEGELYCDGGDYFYWLHPGGADCATDFVPVDAEALPDGCTATLGEWRACYEAGVAAAHDNPCYECTPDMPPACDPLLACLPDVDRVGCWGW